MSQTVSPSTSRSYGLARVSKRPIFTAKAIAKYGRDCALPGFARALAACAG